MRNLMRLQTLLVATAALTAPAMAADFTWTGFQSAGWGTSQNWAPIGIPGAGDSVTFASPLNPTISLGSDRTVDAITFGGAVAQTLNGSSDTLTVEDITVTEVNGTITHTINTDVVPQSGARWEINGNERLAVTGDLSGTAGISKRGTGRLTLSGSNGSYSGDITVNAGELRAGVTNSLGNSTNVGLQAAGTLRIVENEQFGGFTGLGDVILEANGNVGYNDADAVFDGVISGSGSLFKGGTGTLSLGGDNTYSGASEVRGGTLLLTNASGSATGTGSVEVQDGGTLSGDGISSGTTTVLSGGGIAPGDGLGILTLGGVTFDGGSGLYLELGGLVVGSEYDQLEVAGTATLGGDLNIAYAGDFEAEDGDAFVILTGGTLTGAFSTVDFPGDDANWLIDYDAVNGQVTIQYCLDSDGDGVCNRFDACPGFDDNVDTDGDGIPDGCAVVGVDWNDADTGVVTGTLCGTAVSISPVGGVGNRDFAGPDFSFAPLSATQEVVGYDVSTEWTATFDPPVTDLLLHLGLWRGASAGGPGPVSYTFDQSFEIVSGLSDGSQVDNTLFVPLTSFHSGIVRFAGPVSSLSLTTSATATGAGQAMTFGLVGFDADADGVLDDCDVCPGFDDNVDADGDGIADGCDLCNGDDATGDTDGDGVCDDTDPCPLDSSNDSDNDGVCDSADVCPGFDDNVDADGDGVADGCDICPGFDDAGPDADHDSVPDACDACPGFDDTLDADGDGVADDCDACFGDNASGDTDGDGFCDTADNCPLTANPDQADIDSNGVGDLCDACPDADDFDDGNDTGWTRINLGSFFALSTYSFPNGGYRIEASPDAFYGQTLAGSAREGFNYTDSVVSVDLVDWDDTQNQTIGLVTRLSGVSTLLFDGYMFSYTTGATNATPEHISLLRVDGGFPASGDPNVPVDLDPSRDYRFVLEATGSRLVGKVFELPDLRTPVATVTVTDGVHTTGSVGILVANAPGTSGQTGDATFDNFSACLFDADGDGISDAQDACFGDNASGDSDGDGVCDASDVCPGFDDMLDADLDGVPDDCDICPGFDDNVDADGNGVPDGCDATSCLGDTDGDGDVDLSDLALLLSQFGETGSDFAGDVDADGDVDLSDLAIVLGAFGASC